MLQSNKMTKTILTNQELKFKAYNGSIWILNKLGRTIKKLNNKFQLYNLNDKEFNYFLSKCYEQMENKLINQDNINKMKSEVI